MPSSSLGLGLCLKPYPLLLPTPEPLASSSCSLPESSLYTVSVVGLDPFLPVLDSYEHHLLLDLHDLLGLSLCPHVRIQAPAFFENSDLYQNILVFKTSPTYTLPIHHYTIRTISTLTQLSKPFPPLNSHLTFKPHLGQAVPLLDLYFCASFNFE